MIISNRCPAFGFVTLPSFQRRHRIFSNMLALCWEAICYLCEKYALIWSAITYLSPVHSGLLQAHILICWVLIMISVDLITCVYNKGPHSCSSRWRPGYPQIPLMLIIFKMQCLFETREISCSNKLFTWLDMKQKIKVSCLGVKWICLFQVMHLGFITCSSDLTSHSKSQRL